MTIISIFMPAILLAQALWQYMHRTNRDKDSFYLGIQTGLMTFWLLQYAFDLLSGKPLRWEGIEWQLSGIVAGLATAALAIWISRKRRRGDK